MKINFKKDWILWILLLSPLIPVLMYWDQYPDKIPTHWNMQGEVDSYGGKWALFLSPVINAGLYLLMILLPKIDPRSKNYTLFEGAYWWIRVAITMLIASIGFITAYASLGFKLDVGLIIQSSCVILFLVIGNQFGKVRPNYFVGIRTPWTLNNEDVWMRTHRLSARIWVIASLLMLPLIFLVQQKIGVVLFIIYLTLLVVFPVVYSWSIHKAIVKEKHGDDNIG
jgi:uncharacterized membrane protein